MDALQCNTMENPWPNVSESSKPRRDEEILNLEVSNVFVLRDNRIRIRPLSQALISYFNFGHYVLLCPFKIHYDPTSGLVFPVRSGLWYKAIQFLMAAVGLLTLLLGQFLVSKSPASAPTPKECVDILLKDFTMFGWLFVNFVLKLEVWSAAEKVATLVNALQRLEMKLEDVTWHGHWVFRYPVGLALIVNIFMPVSILIETVTFFIGKSSAEDSISRRRRQRELIPDVVLFVASFFENLVLQFGTKLVFLLALLFFSLASSCQHYFAVKRNSADMLQVYRNILHVSSCAKSCFGVSVSVAGVLPVPYYAHRVLALFSGSWTEVLFVMHEIGTLGLTLYAGATANEKFSTYITILSSSKAHDGQWLHSKWHNPKVDRSGWKMLLFDSCTVQALGIRGRSMAINFAFVGAVIACTVGYSITIVQLQSD